METFIRPAQAKDQIVVLAIFNEVIANSTAIYQNQLMTTDQMTEWFEAKQAGAWPIWIAEESGAAVGFATYGPFRARECYQSTVELAVHIASPYRGRGIGKMLLTKLIESAREQNYHVMMAGIDSANQGSIKLHEKFGFKTCGELRQVARKFDRWLNLTFMQLILK